MKFAKHQQTFQHLGEQWDISEELISGLEEFTCLIYGFPRTKSVNDVRTSMLKKMVEKKQMKLKNVPILICQNFPRARCHSSLIVEE